MLYAFVILTKAGIGSEWQNRLSNLSGLVPGAPYRFTRLSTRSTSLFPFYLLPSVICHLHMCFPYNSTVLQSWQVWQMFQNTVPHVLHKRVMSNALELLVDIAHITPLCRCQTFLPLVFVCLLASLTWQVFLHAIRPLPTNLDMVIVIL